MLNPYIRNTFSFIFLLLLQVMVLNNFTILGWSTPYLYIYFFLTLPTNFSKSALFTLGFIMGLTLDVFCNTLGMHIIATLITLVLREPALLVFFTNEEIDKSYPSAYNYGLGRFMIYTILLLSIHHFTLLLIESFVLIDLFMLLSKTVLSVMFTALLILCVESIKMARK